MTPLRAFRKKNKLTLGAVAPQIGVSESQLSRIEREGTASLDIALRLAELTAQPIEAFSKAQADATA